MFPTLPCLISFTLGSLLLVSVSDSVNIPPYSGKCPKISPVQVKHLKNFEGHWHLFASNNEVPFTCANYENIATGPNQFQVIAKAKTLNGKVYVMTFTWKLVKGENPKGLIAIAQKGLFDKPKIMYFLALEGKGALVVYTCEEVGDRLNEVLLVGARPNVTVDKVWLDDLLKKNNLSHLKLVKTYERCPKDVDIF